MNRILTLQKSALAKLIDSVIFPDPDGAPWHGPGGPVVHSLSDRWSYGMINPQPIPPREYARLNEGALRECCNPLPWLSARIARGVIDGTIARYRAAFATGEVGSEKSIQSISSDIKEFADEVCGNGRPRFPWPWPWPLTSSPVGMHFINILVMAAQFQKAADATAESALQSDFAAAANQLFEAGLQKMQESNT